MSTILMLLKLKVKEKESQFKNELLDIKKDLLSGDDKNESKS